MAIVDLQAYMQELLQRYDAAIDTTPGSKADATIIQPLLRRLGSDPFSMDIRAFILDRLNQEFPDLATKDGDALVDLLVKPLELLFSPIVRENVRIKRSLSFKDPSTLTIDEAEALGANFFVERSKGKTARGVARNYFTKPQSIALTPTNYYTSRAGTTFFPENVQSISVEEMLFNKEGELYYFDVNVVASNPGTEYNIEADQLISVAGISSAVRVTNKRRFKDGTSDESVIDYVGRIAREINEKSLVTLRGIVAKVSKSFPEVTRIGVVGFQDPEMQRDVIKGGGYGPIIASSRTGQTVPEPYPKLTTNRIQTLAGPDGLADFVSLIGPVGPVPTGSEFFVTVGSPINTLPFREYQVKSVISTNTIELVDADLANGTLVTWQLRKKFLSLSDIPGGILFPNGPNGTLEVPDNVIHIGGATDVYLRSTELDSASLTIDSLADESPILFGYDAAFVTANTVKLSDYGLLTSGPEFDALSEAVEKGYVLQILDGRSAGTYAILAVDLLANPPEVTLDTSSLVIFSGARWRLVDDIDVNLLDPKDPRIDGADLQTTQASAVVTTSSLVNFDEVGVAANDTLEIFTGPDAGTYTVISVASFPAYTQVTVDRPLTTSSAGLRYALYRSNSSGGASAPVIRVTSVDLLDTNSQATGTKIPFASPLGSFSTAFANPARGVKLEIANTYLGIIGVLLPAGNAAVSGKSLQLRINGMGIVSITFAGVDPISLNSIRSQINTAVGVNIATVINATRLAILPYNGRVEVVGGTTYATSAVPTLFGTDGIVGAVLYLHTGMIRADVFQTADYLVDNIKPALDIPLDVVEVLTGNAKGFYDIEYVYDYPGQVVTNKPLGLTAARCISVADHEFNPELSVFLQLGARSLGTARVYFLDPTSFEVDSRSRFEITTAEGVVLRYLPDPTLDAQIVPALPAGSKPKDGVSSLITFTSASTDFFKKGVRPGDILVIDYKPILSSILTDPVVNLHGKTLILSVQGGANKTITFIHDNNAIPATDVTRAGVATQINTALGKDIAYIDANRLVLNAEVALTILKTGTSNTTFGFSALVDTTNQASVYGRRTIVSIPGPNSLEVDPGFVAMESALQFKIFRAGVQRIGATQMSTQVGPTGLYYADVELLSEGTGDEYNIDADTPMTVTGYRSDGFYLTTTDSNTSFSSAENTRITFSRTINEIGTDDDRESATNLLGQAVQVNYQYSAMVSTAQDYLGSDLERVVCASPLARHLVPHFVRVDLQYAGGTKETDIKPELETLIHATFPDQAVEVSDITGVLSGRGADSISHPITLFAVVYNRDRTVTLQRSQDRISLDRMGAFYPDVLNLTRKLV